MQNGRSYSCVMAKLPKAIGDELIAWGKQNIPDEDLFTSEGNNGRETDPHVTILYGLHTDDVDVIKDLLADEKTINLKLGKITYFTNNPDYDVIKVDVESDDLERLNTKLKTLDYTNKYTDYKPHATIAYVKKGKRYRGDFEKADEEIMVNKIKFSTKDDTVHSFSLTKYANLQKLAAPEMPSWINNISEAVKENLPMLQGWLKQHGPTVQGLIKQYGPTIMKRLQGIKLPSQFTGNWNTPMQATMGKAPVYDMGNYMRAMSSTSKTPSMPGNKGFSHWIAGLAPRRGNNNMLPRIQHIQSNMGKWKPPKSNLGK